MNAQQLGEKGNLLRKDIVTMCYTSKAGHVGGSLSAIDLINTLYNHEMRHDPKHPDTKDRDRFVLSKGHVAEGLFAVLADCGYFPKEDLLTFSRPGSQLIGHPNNKIAGIDVNTGSLGHGLPLAVGMAIAGKMDGSGSRIYCLMGDGEQAEGSIWEAAMAASHYGLDNLCAILDRNGLQISGSTEQVMALGDAAEKYRAFGFHVLECDGHDYEQILNALHQARAFKGKPTLIVAHTTKGKGVSFMENQAAWHHGVLSEAQYRQAMEELEAAL